MKKQKTFLVLIATTAMMQFTLVACKQTENNGEDVATEQTEQAEAVSPQQTLIVKKQPTTLTLKYPATLKGKQDIAVYPQVEGKIVKVCVEEGQTVKKGQPLFIIDQVSYQAALTTARANLQAAKAKEQNMRLTHEGNLRLRANHIVSDFTVKQSANEWKSAQAEVLQAKAAVTNAANSLSYTVVKSPSAGVIGSLPYKIGALVSGNMTEPLTYVSDNGEMVAYYSLDEQQLSSLMIQYGGKDEAIRQMPKVKWQTSDGSTYAELGKVITISGILDPKTGTVSVRAAFPNQKRMLVSGATGNILMSTTLPHAIVIPQTAVSELQDKIIVYKVVDGKAKMQTITVNPINDGKNYVVTSGLKAGDRIKK